MKLSKLTVVASMLMTAFAFAPIAAQAQERVDGDHHGIRQRLENQHDRIREGVRSGELTHREARMLSRTDRRIRMRAKMDRLAHHGYLTARERRRLARRLNHSSRVIYRHKHD